jgi:hypothetical protein
VSKFHCTTPDCTSDSFDGYLNNHLGILKPFCDAHSRELTGVRQRITALLAQIEGLNRVVRFLSHNHVEEPCLACAVENTAVEQGTLLVQLIKRERVLTGAAESSK